MFFPLQNRRLSEPSFRYQFFDLDVAEADFDAAAVMDLQADGAVAFTDLLIFKADHGLTIKPGVDLGANHAGTEGIPLVLFEGVEDGFLWELEPAAAVGLIDAAGFVLVRGNLDLPATHLGAADSRADKHTAVAVGLQLKLEGDVKIVVGHIGAQITILGIGAGLGDQRAILGIPFLGAVGMPVFQIGTIEQRSGGTGRPDQGDG